MLPRLSDYHIFQGNPSQLVPSPDFTLYELSTQLFTDYAEKQRLIKIPFGQVINPIDNKLPDFPSGTLLVKTFYYYHNNQDTSKGKQLIETRLLIKSESGWSVGTYLWNEQQTDADLITSGLDKHITWTNDKGVARTINYHVPANKECTTCHQSQNAIIPIGPKMRNLNIAVERNGASINQLDYFNQLNLMDNANPSSFNALPDWKNTSHTLEERIRAYFDVNCAHCHNAGGFASDKNIHLSFEVPLEDSRITHKRSSITNKFESGAMPKLGTTIVDEEALALIKEYMRSLN
ncbi:MAG TPA: c-type cytochrome [Cyclobacteriaceae bacterium]